MLVKATGRKMVCRGEEASVSRITASAYPFNRAKDLVERKAAPIGNGGNEQKFKIYCKTATFSALELVLQAKKQRRKGEVLSYHALQVAQALFPENFQKVLGIRFSRSGKTSCIYSEAVPDATGTIARKSAWRKAFHEIEGDGVQEVLVRNADAIENDLCPSVRTAYDRIMQAGITVPHPAMNYHFDGKNVVFFEVVEIRLDMLASAILSLPEGSQKTKASVRFGLLVAAMLRIGAEKNLHHIPPLYPQISQSVLDTGLARLMVGAATRTAFVVGNERRTYESPPLLLHFKDAPGLYDNLGEYIYKSGDGIDAVFLWNRHARSKL